MVDKAQLLSHLSASLYKEFGETKELKIQLASKYREMSKLPGVFPGKANDILFAKLRLRGLEGSLKKALEYVARRTGFFPVVKKKKLISDLMHMHLNRLLVDQPRQQELVLYYCLWKHYQSVASRQKEGGEQK